MSSIPISMDPTYKTIPLEVPRLMCAQAAEQAIALAWPGYRIEKIECPA
jgi:hypothetical protein